MHNACISSAQAVLGMVSGGIVTYLHVSTMMCEAKRVLFFFLSSILEKKKLLPLPLLSSAACVCAPVFISTTLEVLDVCFARSENCTLEHYWYCTVLMWVATELIDGQQKDK